MIKIRRSTSGNLNFIDDRNNFVGFDTEQQDSEVFSYEVVKRKNGEKFNYDEEYFPYHFVENEFNISISTGVRFTMEHDTDTAAPILELVLTNVQNGYYSHFFDYDIYGKEGEGYI